MNNWPARLRLKWKGPGWATFSDRLAINSLQFQHQSQMGKNVDCQRPSWPRFRIFLIFKAFRVLWVAAFNWMFKPGSSSQILQAISRNANLSPQNRVVAIVAVPWLYEQSDQMYRVTRHLESYIRLQSIWGVPPLVGCYCSYLLQSRPNWLQ